MADIPVLEQQQEEVGQRREPQPAPAAKRKASYRIPRKFFLGLVGLIGLVILGFMVSLTFDLPPLTQIENPSSNLSTQVYAVDGEVLDHFFSKENRVPVKLSEISPYVVDALVSTEDARFYEHSGVDTWSLPALIKRNLSGVSSGASTITMQLSRNLFDAVGRERTVKRKLKEIIVSAILEKNYTKQEIIEAYLNTVNIYSNAYGIEMAAKRLFGVSAKDLKIEQAAVLVAMLKGQGVYDPIRKADKVVERRNFIINNMAAHQFIPADSAFLDSVKALPLITAKQGLAHQQGSAQYLRQAVRKFMQDWCASHMKQDGTPYDFYTDGLKVYTTIDSKVQEQAEQAVTKHLTKLQATFDKHIRGREPYKYDPSILMDLMHQSERYHQGKEANKTEAEILAEFEVPVPMRIFSWEGEIDTTLSPMDSLRYYARFLETGMVSIDPRNGQIKAWVGGINFSHFKYDHVAQGKRQVGSTFKPFVYGKAIESGFSPCTQILNQPITFENVNGEGDTWSPKNADGEFGGLMTLRRALATSTNLVTANLMSRLQPQNVVDFAHKVGIQSDLEAVPALCLGAADLSVLELTGAYCTFANAGVYIEPYFISRIEDKNGNVLATFGGNPRQGCHPNTAYQVVELLRGVVDEPGGTASRLRYRYQMRGEIAAKTGTTQKHADGWFVGMTQNLVSGVWVGCADRRMRFTSMSLGQGANMALPIWAYYMKSLYDDPDIQLQNDGFERPSGARSLAYCDEPTDRFADREALADSLQQTARSATSSDDLDSFE